MRTNDFREIISLVNGPHFGLCNECDNRVAAWIKENCKDYDSRAETILKRMLRICPRNEGPSPTISAILDLIVQKPRRFTEDEFVYRAVFSLRNRFPEAWEVFLKKSEKVNRHGDWLRLYADLGYNDIRDLWDPDYRDYVMKMLEQTADQSD